ncbi:hypothetical protein CVT25_012964 [Psilocybe cyanescens]|uniref:Uncharacterized protein n=1 Tax=Psilocybe cyanescens TaxID=93625 RepID=A0A409X7P1_PSICY|nr:hypothetical protein CVT25_012964 [Psilocybe cyanescens]
MPTSNTNAITDNRLSFESAFYTTCRPSSLKAAVDNVGEFAYVADIFFFCEFGQFGHLGSGVSVRWDEQGLETVRKMRRREREGREKEVDVGDNDTDKESAKERRGSKERRVETM